MPGSVTLSPGHGLAIALAALGAVLFGLAAMRQHGAVQQAVSAGRQPIAEHLRSGLRLLRQPSWLIGAVQATVAGALHIIALALAPITLVQPIGVLAVPVTVVAAAARARRRPKRTQVLGTVLSVGGIAALTVALVTPSTETVRLPPWWVLATTVVITVAAGGVVTLVGSAVRPLVRCTSLAVAAAVLFGLNSILIRTIGHLVARQAVAAEVPTMITSVVGIAVALPVGLWAMQTAYLSGSPQVVICCLTLVDPLAAVVGGRLLLHDGGTIGGLTLLVVTVCALVAAVGVVLLSVEYPDELTPGHDEDESSPAATPAPTPVPPDQARSSD